MNATLAKFAGTLIMLVAVGAVVLGLGALVLPYSAHEILVKLYVYVIFVPYVGFWCFKLGGDAIERLRSGNLRDRQEGYTSVVGFLILLFLVVAAIWHLVVKGF